MDAIASPSIDILETANRLETLTLKQQKNNQRR
jgi:hypothetical protein